MFVAGLAGFVAGSLVTWLGARGGRAMVRDADLVLLAEHHAEFVAGTLNSLLHIEGSEDPANEARQTRTFMEMTMRQR